MEDKAIIMKQKVLTLRIGVDTRERIRINERSVLSLRQDRPGLSQMEPRTGPFYWRGRNPSVHLCVSAYKIGRDKYFAVNPGKLNQQ